MLSSSHDDVNIITVTFKIHCLSGLSTKKKESMKIKGRSRYCSLQFIRAWIQATACILSYHNYPVDIDTLFVHVLDLSKRVNKVTGKGVGGTANWKKNKIELSRKMMPESLASTIIHEMIHLGCRHFGNRIEDKTMEKCTSTLTAKLKPKIQPIAQMLIDETQVRAGYFAHTKIAYKSKTGKDYYDKSQWIKTGAKDKWKHHKEVA
jgi:hypothetical protein